MAQPAHNRTRARFPLPITLVSGTGVIFIAEALLAVDVAARGGAVVPYHELPPPEGVWLYIARFVALNLTPICWFGALLILDGLLLILARTRAHNSARQSSPVRERPKRFALCVGASIPIWLLFDWANFSFLRAWDYHGLPENFLHRNAMYFFSFAAICPAMFLLAEVFQRLGFRRLRGPSLRLSSAGEIAVAMLGLSCLVFPLIVQRPVGTVTIWLGWLFLLDPINGRFGAPSLLGDLRRGSWSRTVSLMVSGITCGLLWEFWNYWATAKWTYDLPFLGHLEEIRYFEMPVLGMFGFPFFALECWVMFQSVVILVDKTLGGPVEPLPSDSALL